MGKEFYEASEAAKAVIDQADAVMANGLKATMFNGPVEKLTATAYCQPAIFTMSVALLKAFEAHPKFKEVTPKFAAGLSLGEYSALAAAGALSFEDTLELVRKRSALMEEATRQSAGKMAAIIGLDKEKIIGICAQTGAQVANFNSPQQIVITGHADKVVKACELIKAAGAKTVIPLEVSGAFHSSLMKPAADRFAPEVAKVKIKTPEFPVLSNVDAVPETDPAKIGINLTSQITSSVQWVATINYMAQNGIGHFIEIGPGKVLTGLLRRINKELKGFNIERPEDIEKLVL